jgi:RHS repeat-associated protein
VEYLHNALGQRVFKSDVVAEQNSSNKDRFGNAFLHWLTANFGWLFDQRSKSRLGLVFVYDEQGNLIASYSDGSSSAAAQQMEVIWLPLEDGTSIPVGVYKGGQFYAVHTDHLGTPRLITDSMNDPVWQWPYSAFGNNKPTGVLGTITTTGKAGAKDTQLKGTTSALDFKLRFPGQYCDDESLLCDNWWRSYRSFDGGYTQMDPRGLSAGLNRRIYVNASPLLFSDPLGLETSVDAAIRNAIAKGDVQELQTLLEAASPEQSSVIRSALDKFGSRATDWIAKNCKGSVNREFPGELRDKTLKEILDQSRTGDAVAKKAWKLLNDGRFQK